MGRDLKVPDFLLIAFYFLLKALDLGLFGCCRRWSCSTVCREGGRFWETRVAASGLEPDGHCKLGRKEWKKKEDG